VKLETILYIFSVALVAQCHQQWVRLQMLLGRDPAKAMLVLLARRVVWSKE
jgi:hypothetical protein